MRTYLNLKHLLNKLSSNEFPVFPGSLQCLKLKDNGGLCPPVFIPCSDFGHMPQSQFLVVIHPAGLVYLYDGVCQVELYIFGLVY